MRLCFPNHTEMKFLLFGVTGMLGRTIYAYLRHRGYTVIGVGRAEHDVETLDISKLQGLFDRHDMESGDWVINAAGAIPQRVSQLENPGRFIRVNSIFPRKRTVSSSDRSPKHFLFLRKRIGVTNKYQKIMLASPSLL